ncbi:MAG: PEP-CTERM system TPR-repeat protein PrsT [Gammaproteobacteria bacterium]
MVATFSKKSPVTICLLLVVTALTIAGCSKPKSSYDYLNQARQDREKGNDHAAFVDLKNALQKDPKNGEARLLLAQLLNDHRDGSAAEIELRKAMDLGVNKSYIAAAMGQALLLQQKYQKVIDTINVAEGDKGKVAADIYNVRGNAYLALKKEDEARAAFERALKEYQDSADAYLGLARLAAMKNDLDGALHQTDIALSKDANSTMAWLVKASLLKVQGKDEEARAAFGRILRRDKNNVSAHLGLASIDMAQNKLGAAKTEIDAALKSAPTALVARYALALIQFRQGNFKEAHESIQEVLKVVPDDLPSILMDGAVTLALGSYEQALNDLNRVIARYPANAYARRLLATTHLKLGELGPAMETLQPLLASRAKDAQALALAGEIQLRLKNYSKAAEYLKNAIDVNPAQGPKLRTQLALSRLGAGDTEQAMADLEEAAKQSPGQSTADSILITIYLRHKDYDQALVAIANLEKKLGPNPVTYTLRGSALLGKRDFAGARQAFEQALSLQPTYFQAAANLAKLDMRDGKPDRARGRFKAILEKDKNNVQAMLALAELAASQQQEQEYGDWLEKAAEAQPDAIVPRLKLADYYLAKKDKARALRNAREMIAVHPDNLDALRLLGATQLAFGDNDDALRTYARLVEKAPNNPLVYVNLASAQLAAKKMGEARASLNKALELRPDSQQVRDALISLDMASNKEDDALKIARQLQVQRPKSPLGYEREADILMTQKHYGQAAKAYEQSLANGAGSAVVIKLHQAQIMAGDREAAEKRLTSWLDQNPTDIAVITYAADYYMRSNRSRDAIVQYEKLLKLAPQNVLALNNLAYLYGRAGDSRALSIAKQAFKLAPDNPGVQDTLGWILVDHGEFSHAIELLRKAVTSMPKEGMMHYHLGVALARSGQKVEAKKELQAAIAGSEKFPGRDDAIAMLKGL